MWPQSFAGHSKIGFSLRGGLQVSTQVPTGMRSLERRRGEAQALSGSLYTPLHPQSSPNHYSCSIHRIRRARPEIPYNQGKKHDGGNGENQNRFNQEFLKREKMAGVKLVQQTLVHPGD